MANIPISSLPSASSVATTDGIIVETASGTQKASVSQIRGTVDASPTRSSTNPVQSGGVYTELTGKQDALTFDNSPTQNSSNPVKSGGVYSALAGKVNTDGAKVLTPNPVVITASSASAPSDTTALWVYPA